MSAALKLEELLYDTLESLSLPDVYIRLREVMDSETASIGEAAEIISLDPALAARVLRISNSAFFGFRSEVDTITRAANILGLQKIHDLVLAASVSKAFDGVTNDLLDMDTFWYRSVHAAFLAQALADGAGMHNTESLFVRGLLHDIGHLVLFSHFPNECRKAIRQGEEGLDARLYEEQELIGIDAMQFGAQLAAAWQLPPTIVDSFRNLMRPEDVPGKLAREIAILHVAMQFSHAIDTNLLMQDIVHCVRASVWRLAELPPEVGPAALDAATMDMVDAMYNVITAQEVMP